MPLKPRPCCLHHQIPRATRRTPARWFWVSEILEIIICWLCSLVMCVYTIQHGLLRENIMPYELVDGPQPSEQHVTAAGGQPAASFVLRPSPELMLLSCLLFGCCVSSFTHRRQSQDPFQFVVYLVLLGGAALVGYGLRADPHLVLLGYLPFATCAAMAITVMGHGAYSWLKPDVAARLRDEEKAQPAG
ncbi:hypothetical protein C8A05DRAFT_40521 [Staphylotrichum tortipilum]|uniref:Uncharacterized protein n=1 Tax=Staphylotrichum tortipilum TaxID=2831512 RepID=A0AAN6MUV0_9PEZI|nr:hypothetical protein C8A05DRAFT_40521 [Staphylotrichum longicolle]